PGLSPRLRKGHLLGPTSRCLETRGRACDGSLRGRHPVRRRHRRRAPARPGPSRSARLLARRARAHRDLHLGAGPQHPPVRRDGRDHGQAQRRRRGPARHHDHRRRQGPGNSRRPARPRGRLLDVGRVRARAAGGQTVVDLAMPTLNGIDTCRELHRVSARTKAIVLSMYREDRYVLEALRAGTKGYVLKTQAASDLGQAIREVARGGIYLSPGVSRAVVEAFLAKTELPPEPLSPRERQVLQLVAEGKSTKEVAAVLGISVKTAESHGGRLMGRLDIHDTAGLVRYAIRHGLIQP